jgi:small subunit ribosomal protein S14
MARKSLIQREKKKQRLEQKYRIIRQLIKKKMGEALSLDEKWQFKK